MTWRDLRLVVGLASLGLAALVGALAIFRARRRTQAGRSGPGPGVVLSGLFALILVFISVTSFINLPPPQLVNKPAPAAAGAQVVFVTSTREGLTRTIEAVSARDGSTRWTRTLPDSVTLTLYPSPQVVIAVVPYNAVYGLSASDGAIVWQYPIKDYLPSVYIAADATRLYFLASTTQANGQGGFDEVALDLATGAVDWQTPVPAAITNPRHLALAGDTLLFAGDAAAPPTMDAAWTLMASDAATGALRWTAAESDQPANAPVNMVSNILVAGDVALVVRQRGTVTALRMSDGATVWDAAPGFSSSDPPQIFASAADATSIYLLAQSAHWPTGKNGATVEPPVSLLAVDAASGAVRWRATAVNPGSSWTALSVSDGVALVGVNVRPNSAWIAMSPPGSGFFAYDAGSGRALWSAHDLASSSDIGLGFYSLSDPQAAGSVMYLAGVGTDPYVADGCLILCPGISWLYAVNVHTGAPWWRARIGYVSLFHLVY